MYILFFVFDKIRKSKPRIRVYFSLTFLFFFLVLYETKHSLKDTNNGEGVQFQISPCAYGPIADVTGCLLDRPAMTICI